MDKLREDALEIVRQAIDAVLPEAAVRDCLLYTSDAADEL